MNKKNTNTLKKARYIRQSSQTQKNYRQLAIAHPDEKLFIDVISGSIPFAERPEGKKLIEAVVAQRSVKGEEEVAEIEYAMEIIYRTLH